MHTEPEILITTKLPKKSPLSYTRFLYTQCHKTDSADDLACYSYDFVTDYTCSIMAKLCDVQDPTRFGYQLSVGCTSSHTLKNTTKTHWYNLTVNCMSKNTKTQNSNTIFHMLTRQHIKVQDNDMYISVGL